MKEKLFFRATKSIIQNWKFNSLFLKLILLPLLCISSFFNATALEINEPQQDQQPIIYVSGASIVIEIGEATNSKVVKINDSLDDKIAKEVRTVKIKKQIPVSKEESKNQIKNLPKSPAPRFVFKSTKLEDFFNKATFTNTKNSVISLTFFSKNIVVYYVVARNIPVFTYLMNIYTADFARTEELSQFLFSRPPPTC
ncbi:hypothetical protein ACK1KB_11585 [Chryseobacterium sp. TY3]